MEGQGKRSSARSARNASELSYRRFTLRPALAVPSQFSVRGFSEFLRLQGEVVSSFCINEAYNEA